MKFLKMHGLGNDFVIIDGRSESELLLMPGLIRSVCDRRLGVGCDQLIVMEAAVPKDADVFMRIYNPDGSESGACGNATRCVADIVMQESGTHECTVETRAGLLACWHAGEGLVRVDMGPPRLLWNEIPLARECDTLSLPLDGEPVTVSMGNPHCVFFLDQDVESFSVSEIGARIENDPLFPQRTNVEFCNVLDRNTIRMRVWERGAGETQACGSGACAALVAAVRRGLSDRKATIRLNGGDLEIEWKEETGHVLMSGPVSYVFNGDLIL